MTLPDSELLHSAFGVHHLQRDINTHNAAAKTGRALSLKAWNAADEYLLDALSPLIKKNHSLYILNDHFGALTTCLSVFSPVFVSDSFCARAACKHNLEQNPITGNSADDTGGVQFFDCLTMPKKHADFVILQVPKSHAMLEAQLYLLREIVDENTQIIAAGMTKYIHKNTVQYFEKIIGETRTSLAKKKARLIFCQPKPENWQGQSPYPSRYRLEGSDHWLINHANVFSQAQLDQGARFFLAHLDKLPDAGQLIDLGCGNGILGIHAKLAKPATHVHFFDESYMAIASARHNCLSVCLNSEHDETVAFTVDNCLDSAPKESVDLILNNPPFHQQHTVGDDIAKKMFRQSKAVLRTGGELWVVGNRHLNYHAVLKRLFGHCQLVASNHKFVLLRARKR